MNNIVLHTLRKLIAEQGTCLCEDRLRLEGYLRDCCGKYPREIMLLLLGVDESIPASLLQSQRTGRGTALFPKLKAHLKNKFALTSEASHWVVESWASALRVGSIKKIISRSLLREPKLFSEVIWSKFRSHCRKEINFSFAMCVSLLVISGFMLINEHQKTFSIQVFSTKAKEDAQSHLCSLMDKGFEGYIVKTSSWHKVRIENFTNREEANQIADFLKRKHFISTDSFVIHSLVNINTNLLRLEPTDCMET